MIEARVKHLQIQPMKGGGPLKLESARMGKAGLETEDGKIKDHSLVVVTKDRDEHGYHNFLTQRVQVDPEKNLFVPGDPRLALVKPSIRDGELILDFGGRDTTLDAGEAHDKPDDIIPVQVWEYRGLAVEVPKLSHWLSDNLKRKVKVARTSAPWNRMSRQNYMKNDNPLRAQDGYPVHAISFEDAAAMFEAIGAGVDPNRFRYQVLLEGLPFRSIHEYGVVEVNGAVVFQPKPCDRCEVTGVDQNTGEFSPIKPLSALSKLNADKWVKPDGQRVDIVGENWLPQDEVILKRGDVVQLKHLREIPLNFQPRRPQMI